jgi:hypothetical protein
VILFGWFPQHVRRAPGAATAINEVVEISPKATNQETGMRGSAMRRRKGKEGDLRGAGGFDEDETINILLFRLINCVLGLVVSSRTVVVI